jgi:Protein of unknown function, DUF481
VAKFSFQYGLFVLSLWLISDTSFSQIVNVESQRIQSDTLGWFGNVGSSFSLTRNVQQVIDLTATAHTEYKGSKGLWLFLVNYSLLKTDTLQFNNNAFAHLRYNRNINRWLVWEAFTQWQENVVQGIGTRALVATGPRFTLSHTKMLRLFAGTAVLYEYEKDVSGPPFLHNDIRNDTYLSATYRPTSTVTVITTVYYQPLFTRIADFRILHDLSIKVEITKRFSLLTSWDYSYDAFPAYGIPRITYTLSNGLSYAFKK